MTHILMQNLRKNYPDIDGVQYANIFGYPPPDGNERANFGYVHRNYLNNPDKIITIEQIKNIATNVFDDIGWNFYEMRGLMQNVIIFHNQETKVMEIFEYQSRYDGHDIEFGKLELQLGIILSTGNRGIATLHPKQRANYEKFIDEIVKQTIVNTK